MAITRIKKGKPYLLSDVQKWGGKGDNLLKLSEVFDVPSGFIISADTYRDWLIDAHLNDFLNNTSQSGSGQGHEAIKAIFLSKGFRPDLIQILKFEFARLKKPVAVRSSAVSEDSSKNSYAGQLETVLGVSNFNEFLNAIREVYASLYTPRVAEYRRRQGLNPDDSLAVVVQNMIYPSVSGVAYSPSPNNPKEILVESTWGLCTRVVGGRTCDIFRVLDTVTCNIVEDLSQKKREMDVYNGRKVVTKKVRFWNVGRPSLTKGQVLEVAKTAKSIERAYGIPMDLEFAFEEGSGKLYVLQARPLTGVMTYDENVVLPNIPADRILARSKNIRKQGIFEGNAVVVRDVDHVSRSFAIDGDLREMNKLYSDGYILLAPEIPPQLEQHVTNARAMVVTECGTTGHAAAIACEKGIIYMGRVISQFPNLLESVRSGTKIGVAASKNEGILYLVK